MSTRSRRQWTTRTWGGGLYRFYRLILFLQILVICVVTQDLSAAGKISAYPIVVLLGGNGLELFHLGIQERYFTEIIMDTYKAIAGSIPKSQFKTQSVFDTVLLYDKAIIVNWSFTSTWRTSQRFLPLESFF